MSVCDGFFSLVILAFALVLDRFQVAMDSTMRSTMAQSSTDFAS